VPAGHLVRVAHRDRVGRPAAGARVRFRDDVLAAAGALDRGRRWTTATSTPKRGAGTGPSPVNRGKPGSKHHPICDGHGTPIHVLTSAANVPDISRALDLLDGYPPIAGRRGRPRRRFDTLLADKGYSSDAFRLACRERGTEPIIPKPKTATSRVWASCATSSSRPSPCCTSSSGSPCPGSDVSTSATAWSASLAY
jgi:transposase